MSPASVSAPDAPAPPHPAARSVPQSLLNRPVVVELPRPGPMPAPRSVRRVAAVVPCYNRRADAEALLGDLSRVDRAGIDLRVLLVDNASDQPLSTLTTPPGVPLEHLRLPTNTGGSGGYNAGMRRVLGAGEAGDPGSTDWAAFDPEFVWLVDSDARVAPDTLRSLLDALETNPDVVAAGSTVLDPLSGQGFELGGHVNVRNGNFEPMTIGCAGVRGGRPDAEPAGLVDADYLAACCALVRADAVRDCGLFPHRFLNGDDVEWFIRMRQITGGRAVGVPWSLAMHPRFDRFPTWTRYYMTRNAFGPIDAVGAGRSARLIRAVREVLRAIQQEIMGRDDLARLHVAGLRDAASHLTIGPARPGTIQVAPQQPLTALAGALAGLGRRRGSHPRAVVIPKLLIAPEERELVVRQLEAAGLRWGFRDRPPGVARAVMGTLRRLLTGPAADVAVVPARGRPDSWFLGRVMVEVVSGGFVVRRTPRLPTLLRAASTGLIGTAHALRLALRRPEPRRTMTPLPRPAGFRASAPAPSLTLAAVVLSHNRWQALEQTIETLRALPAFAPGSGGAILVVDNASTDGTPDRLRQRFPDVRLLALDRNAGVEAFNLAVAQTTADAVLILDDDARPEEMALRRAAELLARRPDLAAVTLHPVHPRTGASEWRFASLARDPRDGCVAHSDRWPVMGCANLIRRADWLTAGGYEAGYFLYRNDTDLALKLLDAGRGVHFNRNWVAHHDTAAGAGARKSVAWHRLATRNWVWTARRHARGFPLVAGAVLGWLWAHRLAGLSPARQRATIAGALEGWRRPAPEATPSDGRAWRDLLRLHLGRPPRRG